MWRKTYWISNFGPRGSRMDITLAHLSGFCLPTELITSPLWVRESRLPNAPHNITYLCHVYLEETTVHLVVFSSEPGEEGWGYGPHLIKIIMSFGKFVILLAHNTPRYIHPKTSWSTCYVQTWTNYILFYDILRSDWMCNPSRKYQSYYRGKM